MAFKDQYISAPSARVTWVAGIVLERAAVFAIFIPLLCTLIIGPLPTDERTWIYFLSLLLTLFVGAIVWSCGRVLRHLGYAAREAAARDSVQ
jgi:hypothetical protein